MLRRASIVFVCLASPSLALATPDNLPATVDAPAPAESLSTPAPAPVEAAPTSGLRNGFSLSAGQEFGGDRDVSGTMFGFDWRIGYRLSPALSFYADSHLSFGSAKEGNGNSGATGTFASAVIGEYELPNRVFFGGGAGFGVLNNPNGPLAQLRVGYYPMKGSTSGKARRLNIALDYRAFFANQGYGTVNHVALTVGYDRF